MEIEGIIFSLVCFSTVIWMITWGVRHLTEIIFPSWADKNTVFEKIWAGVILPTLPGLLGAVGALFPYPFPSPMDEGYAKIVCGIFCGLVSGLMVRVVKSFFVAKLASDEKKMLDVEKNVDIFSE